MFIDVYPQPLSVAFTSACHGLISLRSTEQPPRVPCAGEPQQAGQQTKDVDGRELWMLAEKYEVDGIKPWLVQHAITVESVCAAAHFACMCAEGVCEGLLEAC